VTFLKEIRRFQMGYARNIRGEFAMRCLLLAAGLAFFAAPLSHNFYLFASQQGFRSGNPVRVIRHSGFSGTGPSNHQQYRLLSLDKRYDFKQIVGVPSPFFILTPSPIRDKALLYTLNDSIFIRAIYPSRLRGPPSSSLIRGFC
jgi:hypothetical protein